MIIQSKGDMIILKGALEENQWPAIRSAIMLLLSKHPSGIIIDGSGLTDVSETGSRTFMEASSFIQAHNARVVVAGLPASILAEIRTMPGIRSQLVIASTVEEARASLETGGTTASIDTNAKPAVLVPLVGAWEQAMRFAVAEAQSRHTEIHLLYVLQIPRDLPLGEPVPELEREAQEVLDRAEKLVKSRGLKVRRLSTRARDITDGIAKFSVETRADLIVVAYYKDELARDGARCGVIHSFCGETQCDVAIYCVHR